MTKPAAIRCAIYTRKSSEEGLDQAFNSLDAQREACAAYVQSQAGEGWSLLPQIYDDGGWSGGTMDRPALNRLMADVAAGRVDIIVVYKIDRLTRSLGDFSRIVEVLDAKGASFVSVTQAFNTTTSMGRLTLNVLLSFAQFEREVTGERIRDKIAASKAKGLWMGGNVPLGYEADGRTLKIIPQEADTVRLIFQLYKELGSIHAVCQELNARGVTSKRSVSKAGKVRGGLPMERGALFHLLSNRVYLGQVPHKGAWHPGQHPPILDKEVFEDARQRLLTQAGAQRRRRAGLEQLVPAAPLTGLIFTKAGDKMSPVTARSKAANHRYYVCSKLLLGRAKAADQDHRSALRVPATALESVIIERLARLDLCSSDAPWTQRRALIEKVAMAQESLTLVLTPQAHQQAGFNLIWAQARLGDGGNLALDDQRLVLTLDVQLCRRRGRSTLLDRDGAAANPITSPKPDPALLKALTKAQAWKQQLLDGRAATLEAIGAKERLQGSHIQRLIRLAFLAPDLKAAILSGRMPPAMTLQRLMQYGVADLWSQQRQDMAG